MSGLVRFSVSLESTLLKQLSKLVRRGKYSNRSELIRDMIRKRLVEMEWADQQKPVVGTITLVYDHKARQLADRLVDIQHDHHDLVLAMTHVHISHDLCAEMIMVRGKADGIQHLADALGRQRGVLHAALSMSSTGEELH